jgi:hypothetical protein
MSERPEVNKLALAALVCAVLLLAPVSMVLGVVSLVQIWRRKESGVLFALMAIVISLFVPGAAYSFLSGHGRGMDACIHNQEKAVGALRMVHHLQERHHERVGRYGTLKEIQWKPRVDLRPYRYELVYARQDEFLAIARGEGIMDGDELIIDQGRIVKRVVDKCQRR